MHFERRMLFGRFVEFWFYFGSIFLSKIALYMIMNFRYFIYIYRPMYLNYWRNLYTFAANGLFPWEDITRKNKISFFFYTHVYIHIYIYVLIVVNNINIY